MGDLVLGNKRWPSELLWEHSSNSPIPYGPPLLKVIIKGSLSCQFHNGKGLSAPYRKDHSLTLLQPYLQTVMSKLVTSSGFTTARCQAPPGSNRDRCLHCSPLLKYYTFFPLTVTLCSRLILST